MTSLWDDPLNDISRAVGLVTAALVAPAGGLLGGLLGIWVVGPDEAPWGLVVGVVVGMAVLVAVAVIYVVGLRRADGRLGEQLGAGSRELSTGQVRGQSVPARLVHALPDRSGLAPAVLGTPPPGGPAVRVLATALAPDGPRRVAAVVPVGVGTAKGTPLPLVLHPARRDVAVLDGRVPLEHIRAGDADPRWSGRLPTSATVTGGWRTRLVAIAASVALVGGLAVVVALVGAALT